MKLKRKKKTIWKQYIIANYFSFLLKIFWKATNLGTNFPFTYFVRSCWLRAPRKEEKKRRNGIRMSCSHLTFQMSLTIILVNEGLHTTQQFPFQWERGKLDPTKISSMRISREHFKSRKEKLQHSFYPRYIFFYF